MYPKIKVSINNKKMENENQTQKKKWYKKWWVIVIGLFVLTSFIIPLKVAYAIGAIAGKIYSIFH